MNTILAPSHTTLAHEFILPQPPSTRIHQTADFELPLLYYRRGIQVTFLQRRKAKSAVWWMSMPAGGANNELSDRD